MKIIISLEHPAWVHQFKYIIRTLEKHGHIVKVLAIKKDITLELLQKYNIPYVLIANSCGTNILNKTIIFISTTFHIFLNCLKFKPDIFIGRASPMMAINSFLFQKKHIIFEDTENINLSLFFCRLFSYKIITPQCFKKNLGNKQIRINTNKELFYLHPDVFQPNSQILNEINLSSKDPYIVIRFVAWHATHDFGLKGLSIEDKLKLIKELEKICTVFVSSEETLPLEFSKYIIKLSPEKIHDLIYYSSLLIGESATMTSEAISLGTHAIYISDNVPNTIKEYAYTYKLITILSGKNKNINNIINTAIGLLKDPELKTKSQKKRIIFLKDKININNFFIKNIVQN